MSDSPYRLPSLYDLEWGGRVEDVVFYRNLAGRIGGPILELGCGNGRITLPVARAGQEITGLDGSEEMRVDLARKLARETAEVQARVHVVDGDFLNLELDGRFRQIWLPFHALHHCRTHRQVLSLLAGVRAHLAPQGVFALDVYLPEPWPHASDPGPEHREQEREGSDPRTGARMRSWERTWYDPFLQIHHAIFTYEQADGQREELYHTFRMFHAAELFDLFDLGGFEIMGASSDFVGSPLRRNASEAVLLLRPRPGQAFGL